MTSEQMSRLEVFFTKTLGDGWQILPFLSLDGMEVVEALWPMNDVFRAHHDQISSIAYSAEFETEADQALQLFVEGNTWTSNSPSPGAWRVLMERHLQSLTMAVANDLHGNKQFMPIPQGLPVSARQAAAMLWLQWAMALPFPVKSRASFHWPDTLPPGSLTRH